MQLWIKYIDEHSWRFFVLFFNVPEMVLSVICTPSSSSTAELHPSPGSSCLHLTVSNTLFNTVKWSRSTLSKSFMALGKWLLASKYLIDLIQVHFPVVTVKVFIHSPLSSPVSRVPYDKNPQIAGNLCNGYITFNHFNILHVFIHIKIIKIIVFLWYL